MSGLPRPNHSRAGRVSPKCCQSWLRTRWPVAKSGLTPRRLSPEACASAPGPSDPSAATPAGADLVVLVVVVIIVIVDPLDQIQQILLGGSVVGSATLIRFYVLHVAVLPAALVVVLMIHLWRWRKDAMLDVERSEPDA